MNKIKNILLLYKNSTYASYFLSDKRRMAQLEGLLNNQEIKRFRRTHENHFWSLSYVEAVLKHRKLRFTKICRGTSFNYKPFDLIITVGGDGTFLEAARNLDKQIIWGINSDPNWSVGRFCSGNPKNFESRLDLILSGKLKPSEFNRLTLTYDDGTQPINILNDALICHHNPAALSRYYLTVGRQKEEQKSSGIWIATAAGSSGGIYSAGGKVMPQASKNFQYRPRELYLGRGATYKLTGKILKPTQKITVMSLMREGVVFADGSHVCLPFSFGTKIHIERSKFPLQAIL